MLVKKNDKKKRPSGSTRCCPPLTGGSATSAAHPTLQIVQTLFGAHIRHQRPVAFPLLPSPRALPPLSFTLQPPPPRETPGGVPWPAACENPRHHPSPPPLAATPCRRPAATLAARRASLPAPCRTIPYCHSPRRQPSPSPRRCRQCRDPPAGRGRMREAVARTHGRLVLPRCSARVAQRVCRALFRAFVRVWGRAGLLPCLLGVVRCLWVRSVTVKISVTVRT